MSNPRDIDDNVQPIHEEAEKKQPIKQRIIENQSKPF